jgi:hypothetical protein
MSFSAIARGPVHHHLLVWIVAKNRATGAPEAAGFWTGSEDRAFTIAGVARSYFGVGHVIDVPPIVSRPGGIVQSQRLVLSANSPAIEAALALYDARLAPVEIDVARFDPATMALLGIDPAFRGQIDGAPRTTPAKGGTGAEWTITLVSGMRDLTRALIATRSDASQRSRLLPGGAPDRFFRHADLGGAVEGFWGTERISS